MQIDANRRSVNLDPRAAQFCQNPYSFYERLRDGVPVFKWEQYGHWCFAAYNDVNALLRDRRFGRQILHVASREELGWQEPPAHLAAFHAFERHSLLEVEPPVHTRLRGLVNRAFLSRQIETLRPKISSLCNELIDSFEKEGEVELIARYATPIPLTIICQVLGVPVDMGGQLLDWSHDMVAMYQARRDRDVEDKAERATIAFSAFMRDTIAERRKVPGSDLLSELIRATEDSTALSEDELVTTAILLLNAGHEATVHAIGNAVKTLIETGTTQDIGPGHVEECLRFDPPLHLFTRYALEDLDYRGLRLRKGETVGLLLGAANRDPARFASPHVFMPGRSPNPHVSFGAGIHFCLGAPLARLELELALPILFQRLPKLRLAGRPEYRDSYHFHGLSRLDVHF